ncbi:hypothetical protein F511_41274 [Dorcoceras hygrometricum]|uniref:Uncharacterized protein n=1 Tax=Dorcoceras hygrometricum TaxID=472368 RepID=A0A2Z7BPV5_9LAMI|nr:hypothetical protein F511_41274 [Dorcoceras hygrometricum]
MTSAVTSSFSRSYSDQQEDSADEKSCARYGMSCDDISLDVITISSWLSADGAKRKRRSDVKFQSQTNAQDLSMVDIDQNILIDHSEFDESSDEDYNSS